MAIMTKGSIEKKNKLEEDKRKGVCIHILQGKNLSE